MLEDHDVLAERSLVALGAELPLCVEVLDAWRELREPELISRFLALEHPDLRPDLAALHRHRRTEIERQRAQQAMVRLPASMPAQDRRRYEESIAEGARHATRLWRTTLIEGLPPALQRNFALSLIAAVDRRWHDDRYRDAFRSDVEPVLGSFAAPLFERSARHWRRNLKPYAGANIDAKAVASNERPDCWAEIGHDGVSAVIALPLSWFAKVWAHGIALVDGCFVLCRDGGRPDAPSMPVTAVRWERTRLHTSAAVPAPALLTRSRDGTWSLQWL